MTSDPGLTIGPDTDGQEGEQAPQEFVAHPIEGAVVHFRGKGRCMAATVVDILADNPLDPDFKLDLVVFQPRARINDRFVKDSTVPGQMRWANEIPYAPFNPGDPGDELTWHWPGQACVPTVTIRDE